MSEHFGRTISYPSDGNIFHIDYLEETHEGFRAFEIKWSEKAGYKFPQNFLQSYKTLEQSVVNRQNYEEFLMPGRFGNSIIK